MSKLTWSYPKSADYDTCSLADGLLRHYLTPPPAPAAPPPPTWKPSPEAWEMMFRWLASPELSDDFLRRLYAHLHRDRVAALPVPSWTDEPTIAVIRASKEQVSVARTMLLALADDGTGD